MKGRLKGYSVKLGKAVSDMVRFLTFVEKTDTCWNWTGSQNGHGYGRFRINGIWEPAHKASYILHGGTYIKGMDIDHLCRVRHCVNPKHLEQVTPQENYRRGLHGVLTTHCKNGHELKIENLVKYKNRPNKRECIICRTAYSKNYYQKRKLKYFPTKKEE